MDTKKDFYKYNDFQYKVEYKTNTEQDKIQINHKKEYPKKLFKYFSFSEYSIKALLDSYLYASHPLELNDSLDSSVFLWYTEIPLEFDLYKKVFQESLSKDELKELYENDINNRCNTYLGTYWELLTNLYGIISMTSRENHSLMWPHYTNEKGFKLKFDFENLQNSLIKNIEDEDGALLGLFPMNYSDELQPIDVSPFNRMLVPFFYSVTVKHSQWKYEDEWRFIYSKPQMGVPLNKMGLTNNRDNYLGIKENRFAKYDSNIIEEIVLANIFFNGEDFSIKWNNDLTEFIIRPKKDTKNFIAFLDYVCDNLEDKLFYSGVKYEFNNDKKLKLVRTKEKLKIEKMSKTKYKLYRTNDFSILLP